jgi:hypothetical protein
MSRAMNYFCCFIVIIIIPKGCGGNFGVVLMIHMSCHWPLSSVESFLKHPSYTVRDTKTHPQLCVHTCSGKQNLLGFCALEVLDLTLQSRLVLRNLDCNCCYCCYCCCY